MTSIIVRGLERALIKEQLAALNRLVDSWRPGSKTARPTRARTLPSLGGREGGPPAGQNPNRRSRLRVTAELLS